jgi:hypothetical protein
MDIKLFRQPTIQDALHLFNTDTPDYWTFDGNGQEYSNVISIIDGVSIPSETDVNAKLAELQAIWDAQNADYVVARKQEYKSIQEQLDMQYWDAVNGTTTWKDHITQVKADNPKP